MKRLTVITAMILIAGCSVYGPLENVEPRDVPVGTKGVVIDTNLQTVKEAFVDAGYLVRQDSESEFVTSSTDMPIDWKFNYRIMEYRQKIRVQPAYWSLMNRYTMKPKPVIYDDQKYVVQKRIYSNLVKICQENGLDFEYDSAPQK